MTTSALACRTIETPIGPLRLAASSRGAVHVVFANEARAPRAADEPPRAAALHLDALARALGEYFAGTRTQFDDLTLAPEGTDFQQRVWMKLREIPYGETRSYGDIAVAVENPKGVRAVGLANGRNPLPIVVPCHRVIGADGSLTGFGGGVERKRKLLELEGALTPLLV